MGKSAWSVRKIGILVCAAAAAVVLAVVCAFALLHSAKKNVNTEAEVSSVSSAESVPSSAVSEVPSEPEDNGIRLVLTSPASLNNTVTESRVVLSGTSDPAQPLTMNGSDVARDASGMFAMDVDLAVGNNTFTFLHKGETTVCNFRYRYVVINGYAPSEKQIYASGSTFMVALTARRGSKATATFNGTTIALERTADQSGGEDTTGGESEDAFCQFAGFFTLPSGNVADLNLGNVSFSASYNGVTEKFSSKAIICQKSSIIVNHDPAATPAGGSYVDVGSGYIAEVVAYAAETFDANATPSNIDWSRPTNNYLPQGTVDYCSTGLMYDGLTGNHYVTLRCGRRIYVDKPIKPGTGRAAVSSRYEGRLPDHNEIGVAAVDQSGKHTTVTLNTSWKAPFLFDLAPQSYTNAAAQDYTVSAVTYNYVDITFCYATVWNGEIAIDENNPVFSRAEVIQNQSDYTLRLYLKKTGAFYGWDAYYNENNQLVFEFLHPARVSAASNVYGVDLSGVKILIDVGHGGIDGGASGLDPAQHNEAERNLNLANKLKAELESIGATVVMTRYDNVAVTSDGRCEILKREKPDYCIAIHHDSSLSSASNGFGAFHFDAFSSQAANMVYTAVTNVGIYQNTYLRWHYFYVARMTACPVVLTENGFISGMTDYAGIADEATNLRKAQALTQGITAYFKSIQ